MNVVLSNSFNTGLRIAGRRTSEIPIVFKQREIIVLVTPKPIRKRGFGLEVNRLLTVYRKQVLASGIQK